MGLRLDVSSLMARTNLVDFEGKDTVEAHQRYHPEGPLISLIQAISLVRVRRIDRPGLREHAFDMSKSTFGFGMLGVDL